MVSGCGRSELDTSAISGVPSAGASIAAGAAAGGGGTSAGTAAGGGDTSAGAAASGGGTSAGAASGGGAATWTPSSPTRWSSKALLLAVDCVTFQNDPVCRVWDLTLRMNGSGDVAVAFGSQVRARLSGGSWTAFLADSIAEKPEGSEVIGIRPWLSPDGQRFMASWRYGSGFHAPTFVRSLTIEASDWELPPGQWPKPLDVGGHGFTARDTVPAPPLLTPTDYDLSDMVLSRDGVSAALLLAPTLNSSRSATSLLWWDGSTWTPLALPLKVGPVQWPGYLDGCGQNACDSTWTKSEVSVNAEGLALFGATPPPADASFQFGFTVFSSGAWDPEPTPTVGTAFTQPTWGFELAQNGRAAIADWPTECSVWTGDAWVSQARRRSLTSVSQSTWQSLGVSRDGGLGVCSGDETEPGGASRATVAVWNGAGWQMAAIGAQNCVARDVAVSENGLLAAVGLACPGGPEVAIYRGGTWTVDTLAAEMRGSPVVAVSADGTSAVAVWLEAGGLFAAQYH